MLAQLHQAYPQHVRVVFRHFPLPGHDKAFLATQATEAAALQGKFWEMKNLIFARQSAWGALTLPDFEIWLKTQAASLGLNTEKFGMDMTSEAMVKLAQKAQDDAIKTGIPSTPFLIISGRPYGGPRDYESLAVIVKMLQFIECPPMVINSAKQYTATLNTARGNIVIQLFADKAPMTVNNFVFLARSGWYNGVTFHRVIPSFVAQSGDPTGTGGGGPGYLFGNEIVTDLGFDKAGVVGMANAGEDTNGSQFFITYAAQPQLTGSYTVFGQVLSGMDVAQKLTTRNPQQGTTLPPGDKIIKITIEEK